MTWIMQRLRGLMCGIVGHEMVLNYARDRLSLRCVICGHRTVGWTLRPDTRRRPHHGARSSVDDSDMAEVTRVRQASADLAPSTGTLP